MTDNTAKRKNICTVCGREYEECINCSNIKSFRPWRTVTDTVNCYKIYLALSGYTNGYTDKEETAEELSKCDLSKLPKFPENIKISVYDIINCDSNSTKEPIA